MKNIQIPMDVIWWTDKSNVMIVFLRWFSKYWMHLIAGKFVYNDYNS